MKRGFESIEEAFEQVKRQAVSVFTNNPLNDEDASKHPLLAKLLQRVRDNHDMSTDYDEYTKLWIAFANLKFELTPAFSQKDLNVFPPKDAQRPTITMKGLEFLKSDGQFSEALSWLGSEGIEAIVKFTCALPFNESSFSYFQSQQEVDYTLCKLYKQGALPPQEVYWRHWGSPAMLSKWVFGGNPQYYLRSVKPTDPGLPPTARYCVDSSFANKYAIREPFEKYGVIAYFDADRNCLGLWWCENKCFVAADNDKEFPHVSAIFVATLGFISTVIFHLGICHCTLSNSVAVANLKFLGSDHVMRRLIRPHVFFAQEINFGAASTLLPWRGNAGRLFPLTEPDWDVALGDIFSNFFYYETMEECFTRSGLPAELKSSLPLYADGCDYYKVCEKYITNYINLFYESDDDITRDTELQQYWQYLGNYLPNGVYAQKIGPLTKANLIRHTTLFLFEVTGFHTFIGGVNDLLDTAAGTVSKVQKDLSHTEADIQCFIQANNLNSFTSGVMPMVLQDWSFIFEGSSIIQKSGKLERLKLILNEWQQDMLTLANEVDRRNFSREHPFVEMNPRFMKSSVSV